MNQIQITIPNIHICQIIKIRCGMLYFGIIVFIFIISLVLGIKVVRGITGTYYNYILNKNNNIEESDWYLKIETVTKKEVINKRRSKDYYIFFGNSFENGYKKKVVKNEYNNISEGDKMYVIMDSKNNIIVIYSTKKYRYENDVKLLMEKIIKIPGRVNTNE